MANFKNPKTEKEFTISNFRISLNGGSIVYIDKITKKEIVDPKTNEKLIPINKSGVPKLHKSNDKETRVEMLKKRSKDHYQKEIKEKRYQMNKDLIKKFEA